MEGSQDMEGALESLEGGHYSLIQTISYTN